MKAASDVLLSKLAQRIKINLGLKTDELEQLYDENLRI